VADRVNPSGPGFRVYTPLVDRTHVRLIGRPRPIRVRCRPAGVPHAVGGRAVAELRDEWLVDEGWWGDRRIRRRYLDLVLDDGRNVVVFCDRDGRWFAQRG